MADNQPALLIKLSPTDTGARPLPPGTVFWGNTSIRLLHPSDTTIDDATSKEGVPTTIEVTVTNLSSTKLGVVRVEAYVCNPTPSGASPFNTVAGISADGRFVGLRTVLDAGNSQPINCVVAATNAAWTPTAAQAGHHCVIANTFLDDGSEGAALGPVDLLQPLTNPHHGWRNINVVALVHDQPEMKFAFVVVNPDREEPAEILLRMQEVRGDAAFGRAERDLLRSGPFRDIKPTPSPFEPTSILFEGAEFDPYSEGKLTLEPGQQMDLALVAQFDRGEKVGNLHTFDITTADPKGVIQGGFRLLALFAK